MAALAIDAPGAGGGGGWHSHNFLVGVCRLTEVKKSRVCGAKIFASKQESLRSELFAKFAFEELKFGQSRKN